LQRKCACDGTPGLSKLKVNEPGDIYEQEADQVADQVAAPVHPDVDCTPLHIQRSSGQSADQMESAPASVENVLAGPSSPLDRDLQHGMEQRFGYDFSRVRVHTGADAEQSARHVNAHAYTVGHDIVFGAGQFVPQSQQGRRLIAHELAHVVQQSAGVGPRVQRQSAPDVNKSATFIEETYRSGARQLQDPTLSEAAYNVRLCREQGGHYCEILLTDDDINSKYAEWTLIEDVFDRETANKAIVDHNLAEIAARAAAEVKKRQAATGQYGVAAGGLVALKPLPVSAPVPPTSAPLPYITPLAPPANVNVPVAPPAGVSAAVVPAAVVVFGIIVVVQLWNLGQFQQKLWRAGYKFLPSPRGVCMRDCHQGTRDLPRISDFPSPATLEPLPPSPFQFPPEPVQQLPRGYEPLKPLPRPVTPPVPKPRPDTERRKRRKCSRSPGPCPVWQSRLTAPNEYWNLAYQYRKDRNLLGRYDFNQNVAVLLLEGQKPIIKENTQGLHSEQQIVLTFAKRKIASGCPILGLFSERKPCSNICQPLLPPLCRANDGVPFDVFFAVDYYNSPAGMKSKNNRSELIKSYTEAGYFKLKRT
jgi:hypothetical protein